MRVLDLCTEFGSETAAFRDRGHEVITLGIEGNVDIKCDVRQYYPSVDDHYDFITAHPPCQQFSLANGFQYRCKDRKPDLSVVWACQRIIDTLKPRFWIMENPKACLRYFIGNPFITINYSDFGYPSMKPTDLWGNIPLFLNMQIPGNIKNFRHIKNNRHYLRSCVPYGLSLAICKAIERDLE